MPDLVVGDNFEVSGGAQGMTVVAPGDPPTAVITMHDIMAVGAANAIRLRLEDPR